jgi:hypothetical protein
MKYEENHVTNNLFLLPNYLVHLHLVPPLPQYVSMAWFLIKQEMRRHGVVLS